MRTFCCDAASLDGEQRITAPTICKTKPCASVPRVSSFFLCHQRLETQYAQRLADLRLQNTAGYDPTLSLWNDELPVQPAGTIDLVIFDRDYFSYAASRSLAGQGIGGGGQTQTTQPARSQLAAAFFPAMHSMELIKCSFRLSAKCHTQA
ncbi:hypothetical protein [Actimicrobium sp. CCI2.3]|uniref:hypothetical protein n=1 Tax=Actimicrobium sp. CCI2.3 TaxID=3048616 RepID=UPI002AB57C5F|nr:hypothetical protein [Actimicrobium sp. CCI2.3]MDY7575112.1 hypothetical protein [Actimicrobium sp. CCI2.3]MEB0022547.1 hypothetical protein [Actimicrobium sp. CCI2.3]